jgi:RNA polymerase sigma factor (TIGR02999 family)
MSNLSQLLDDAAAGDRAAPPAILNLVYDELRRMAAARLASERAGHTLQATALVHEAYLRLVGPVGGPGWASRGHFFAAAGRAMRQVLIDHARVKGRAKRGGGRRRVELDPAHRVVEADPARELALDEAIARLGAEDPSAAGVAALHVFAGMSIEEVADSMSLSRSTAYAQWAYARAWLGAAFDDRAGSQPESGG